MIEAFRRLKLLTFTGLDGPGYINTGEAQPGDEILSVVNTTAGDSLDYKWAFWDKVQFNPAATTFGIIVQAVESGTDLSSKNFVALIYRPE